MPTTRNASAQQTQNSCITFVQRRPNFAFVHLYNRICPRLYKCYTNVLRLLGMDLIEKCIRMTAGHVTTGDSRKSRQLIKY